MRIILLTLFLLPGLALAAGFGPMKPGPLPLPGAAGPAHHSRVFVAETTIHNGSATLDVPLDAPANAALVIFDARPVTVRAPQGRALPNVPFRNPAMQSMDVPAMGVRANIASLSRGSHNVKVETARSSGRLKYAVVQPESKLELVLRVAPLAAQGGEPVTVTAMLDNTARAQTKVSAKVRGVGRLSLRDDGEDGDARADDGIYTARFTAPRVKGLRETAIRVDAKGRLADGTRFRRTSTAVAMVSEAAPGVSAADVVVTAKSLRIPVPMTKGDYRVEAIYGAEGQAIAWARDSLHDRRHGGGVVELPRPAIAVAADQVVIRVLDTETLALVSEFALDLQPQAAAFVPGARSLDAPRMPEGKARAARRYGQLPRN